MTGRAWVLTSVWLVGLAIVGGASGTDACWGMTAPPPVCSPGSLVFEWTVVDEQRVVLGLPGLVSSLPADLEFDFEVDWGDGSEPVSVNSEEEISAVRGAATHEYLDGGTYTVVIDGQLDAMSFSTNWQLKRVVNLGAVGWTYMGGMFAHCRYLKEVNGGDLSLVTDMSDMFREAWHARPETSDWNVSRVTNMAGMFAGATRAKPDTSAWDVSSVVDMSQMFYSTGKANPETSGWDVSNVKSMRGMFKQAKQADPDTGDWDVSGVTDMSDMFSHTQKAKPETTHWDVSSVVTMVNMFNLAKKANPDTRRWDVSSLRHLSGMFFAAPKAQPNTSRWELCDKAQEQRLRWW